MKAACRHIRSSSECALTLVEVLVVMAIITVIAGLLLPALNKGRTKAQAIACLNNIRQVSAAVIMYGDDNAGWFPPNYSGAGGDNSNSWLRGWLDWRTSNDNTNVAYLVNSKIGPFTKSPKIFKCPADTYLAPAQRSSRWKERVRSISMNCFIEGGAYNKTTLNGALVSSNHRNYNKMSDVVKPGPAGLWLTTDEHPDSINDAWFLVDIANPNVWRDLPGSFHGGATSFSFVDGHCEIRKWEEKSTVIGVTFAARNNFAATNSRDTQWLIQRSTAPR